MSKITQENRPQNEETPIPDPTEQLAIMRSMAKDLKDLRNDTNTQRQQLEQMRFSISYDFFKEYDALISQRQLSFLETLEKIRSEKMSLSRYGDGEIGMAIHPVRDIKFQRNSFDLSRKLREIIASPRDGLLVAMPQLAYEKFWVSIFARFWPPMTTFLPTDTVWGNAQVSRPLGFEREGEELVNAWRKCWHGRKILIVTGSGSRFQALPEFFDNASDLSFEYSLPKDAYSDLSRIKEQVRKRRPEIVLISLGPAGTILASELSEMGTQALDVGHLTTSYLNALKGGPVPEHLPVRH